MCAYQREISRDHKACVLFLLDRSESMSQRLGGSERRKCDELASAVNNWLHNMAIRASSDDGIRDWLDVGVIGYRTTKELTPLIAPALQGPLAGRPLVSITEIGNHPARIETRTEQFRDETTGEVLEMASDVPVWVDPEAQGSTPMCRVLQYARNVLTSWIGSHPDSFPPMVVHITDGESQDGSPLKYAAALRDLATSDGHVLLFNCHLSASEAKPFVFPAVEPQSDPLASVLYQISSPLPEPFFRGALAEGMKLEPGARGMAFNADMVVLVNFLDMGTRAAVNLR